MTIVLKRDTPEAALEAAAELCEAHAAEYYELYDESCEDGEEEDSWLTVAGALEKAAMHIRAITVKRGGKTK